MTVFYLKFDEDGYIVDLTQLQPSPPDYQAAEIDGMPDDIMLGCYKWNGGLVLDEDKKAVVEAEIAATLPPPPFGS